MESTNEISSNVPASQPSNSVASLGLSLALNCPSGPMATDLQGNEGGAFLPCADSPVPVSNTTPSSQPPLSVSNPPPPCVDTPNTQPPLVFTSTTVSLISTEAREVSPVGTNTTSSPISTEARDKEVFPPETESSSVSIQAETQFVPSLGSWAKPLIFKPVPTPPVPSTPKDYDPALVGNQLAALWPSLNDEILNKKQKSKHPTRSLELPVAKLPPPELKADGTLRFPWAARLSPESRNLYRAASPTYRLDGTPPGGLVHAVANRIWGRSCKISCKKLSDSSYMFHIPHQPTRHWVIQRGIWHIDDCLLFVLPWIPEGSFKIPEVSTLPVWVTLKEIPDCCYSRLGISHVASGLGEPILTHKPRLDPSNMGEAKVLVEMELERDFPKLIALDDKQGHIYLVKVEYTWIPSTCERCGGLGHKAKRCLLPSKPQDSSGSSANPEGVSVDIPIVDIEKILQEHNDETISGSLHKISTVAHVHSPQELNVNLHDVTELHSDLVADSQVPNDPSLPPLECHVIKDVPEECQASKNNTCSTPQVQHDNQLALPSLAKTLSPLVDIVSTPISASIMEISPSNIINREVQKTSMVDPFNTSAQVSGFQSPSRFSVLGDEDMAPDETTSSLGFTRGGRESRPPLKFQDLEWKTVQGRGKHGRRGRGNTR